MLAQYAQDFVGEEGKETPAPHTRGAGIFVTAR